MLPLISSCRSTLAAATAIGVLMIAGVAAPLAAQTGTVRGKVTVSGKGDGGQNVKKSTLTNRYAATKPIPSSATAGAASRLPLSERLVVYLESSKANGQKYPVREARPRLDQRNLQFRPSVLPVLVGSTVEFPNNDNLFHNVFSYSPTKDFDLGKYPKGQSRSVTFDEPGVIRIYCDIHVHMNAIVLVLSNPFFDVPDGQGNFTIPNVPEGDYTLNVWLDRERIDSRPLRVTPGTTAAIDLQY